MPFYEYQCQACGHELEILQKMFDDALVNCPECMDDSLKKKISAAGFQLKGTGWYETDFKNSGSKSENKTDGKGNGNGNDNTKGGKGEPSKKTSGDKKAGDHKSNSSASSHSSGSASSPAA